MSELTDIANAKDNDLKFLGAGLHIVKITDFKWESPEGRVPFFSFTIEDEGGAKSSLRLYRVKEGDPQEKADRKQAALKRLFTNAGADWSKVKSGLNEFAETARNNYFQVYLFNKQYVGYDKKANNKPIIKSVVDYFFSEPLMIDGKKKEVAVDKTWETRVLDERDRQRYNTELAQWESVNGPSEATPTPAQAQEEGDDDLPF